MQLTRWCAPVVVAVCVSFSVLIVNVRHVHGNGDEEQGRQDSGPGTMNVDGVSSSHHELQSNDLTLFDPVPVLSMHNATERAILKHLNLGQPFKLIGTLMRVIEAHFWPMFATFQTSHTLSMRLHAILVSFVFRAIWVAL
eukprot:m.307960 g.307960  ORF g.307960 m.307960 type:complete len:140 (-) comp15938_c0_seq6:1123-1542(-)